MDAFLASTLAVAIAEIGDKTQLLSLFLVARYAKRTPIILGILIATVLNHALSAWLGAWVAQWIPEAWLPWILAVSFVAIALWLLIPDKDDSEDSKFLGMGAFMATTIMFFLAEIGDKTQIATLMLSAESGKPIIVFLGSSLALISSSIVGVLIGKWVSKKISPSKFALFTGALMILISIFLAYETFKNYL